MNKLKITILAALCGGCAAPAVVWINDPARAQYAKDLEEAKKTGYFTVHALTAQFTVSFPGHPTTEFGLRSDGVVVWRDNK